MDKDGKRLMLKKRKGGMKCELCGYETNGGLSLCEQCEIGELENPEHRIKRDSE